MGWFSSGMHFPSPPRLGPPLPATPRLTILHTPWRADPASSKVEAACDELYSCLPISRNELLSAFLAGRQALARKALLAVLQTHCFGLADEP